MPGPGAGGNLAAELWTYWSLSRALLGAPDRTPSQQSRREVKKARMRVSATESESEGRSWEMFLRLKEGRFGDGLDIVVE